MVKAKARQPRRDKGLSRVPKERDPMRVYLYFAGYGVGAKISKAIEDELKRHRKANPMINAGDVVMEWVKQHLGYSEVES